jgi:ABC-type transport system involved in multi-copper enzyme maturation permease subunit
MMQFSHFFAMWALSKNTFREAIRDRILYMILFFAGLLIVSSPLMAKISAGEEHRVLLDFGFAMIHIFGILITVFVGTQLIAREIESKTILVLLSKPIARGSFLIGKFLGLGSVLFVLLTLMGGVFFIVAGFEPLYLLVLLGFFLGLLLLLAIAIFFSTFLSPVLAMFSTFLIFILGNISDDFYLQAKFMFERGQASDAFYWISWGTYHFLPNFENMNFKNSVLYGLDLPLPTLLLFFGITILYILVLLSFSIVFFRKREI